MSSREDRKRRWLKTSNTGLKNWKQFQFVKYSEPIDPTWMDVFTTPIEVTSGRSCYDTSPGSLKINSEQTIASFLSKLFSHAIEVKLNGQKDAICENPFEQVSSDSITVGKGDIVISLMRTVRVPESGKVYDLPPGLGHFPIFNVRPFSNRLQTSVVAQGGLFFPMYRKSKTEFPSCLCLILTAHLNLQKWKPCGSTSSRRLTGNSRSVRSSAA